MKFSDFIISLAQRLYGPLEAIGFKKVTDELFVRFKDNHEINVISIQKHSSESKVCVNFGVHYSFLPKIGTTELAYDGKIELPNCEIKVRASPNPSLKDYWWLIAPESVDEIIDLIVGHVEKFFHRYDIDGDISVVTPDDLGENMPDIVASLTKVRASLVLARIHEARGDLDKAADFATYGIKLAGMAIGPKKMLKEVLKRIEQNQN